MVREVNREGDEAQTQHQFSAGWDSRAANVDVMDPNCVRDGWEDENENERHETWNSRRTNLNRISGNEKLHAACRTQGFVARASLSLSLSGISLVAGTKHRQLAPCQLFPFQPIAAAS